MSDNYKRSGKYTVGDGEGAELPEWHADAACAPVTVQRPEMGKAWLEKYHAREVKAKEICASCPVRKLCIEDALEDRHAEGLRGGVFFDAGQVTKDGAKEIRKEFRILVPDSRIFGRKDRRGARAQTL